MIKQAVILCGGLGTRLRPLTDNLPKPMAPINGKPFLEYLLEQLKDNGITNFLLLTGYKKEAIEEYFGNGSKWGYTITYSPGEIEWDTGKRLHHAKELIDEHFLLMYSDNFVQFNLKKIIAFHIQKKGLGSITLFQKKEKNNIIIDEESKIIVYDKKREATNLKYVELGYMILNKKILSPLNGSNISFSEIIDYWAKEGELYGLVTPHQYHSISDLERLKMTQEYLTPKKIILIDRDGVINEKAPQGEYVTSWEKFKFIPTVIEGMKKLSKQGYSFIIITNQAGIARKKITSEQLTIIHEKMLDEFKNNNIKILNIYICPHHWEEKCTCRKPNPGMLIQASNEFKFRLDKTYFIGDDERDVLTAYNSNCKSILVGDWYDQEKLKEYGDIPTTKVNKFQEILDVILTENKT